MDLEDVADVSGDDGCVADELPPRLSIWEDAVDDGLVQIRDSTVFLTARGEAALNGVRTRQSG